MLNKCSENSENSDNEQLQKNMFWITERICTVVTENDVVIATK